MIKNLDRTKVEEEDGHEADRPPRTRNGGRTRDVPKLVSLQTAIRGGPSGRGKAFVDIEIRIASSTRYCGITFVLCS